MLFSSIPFLFYFLPCVLFAYMAVPKRLKNSVLLLFSCLFYGWGEPKYLWFMLASVVQGYVFGILIERFSASKKLSRAFLAASIGFSIALLGWCKYADFFIENFNALTGLNAPLLKIALPIGISFYTFQILSYVIDIYRKAAPAQKNPIDLAVYISMFPQLIAGPIVRYTDIEPQLKNRTHSIEKISKGAVRFVIGLSKKILLANVLGELVAVYKTSNEKSVLFCWIYAIAYMLHIYFDFSGYSDMAIGLGHIFGFSFCENFNYPYISGSITEFWRRWHISLGSWFRDYLYIPMGGNRVNKTRWFFNIFAVWIATGFWHGAQWNFILWGIMFAVLLIIEKLWLLPVPEKLKFAHHLYVMLMLIISFVIFDAESIKDAAVQIMAMFGFGNMPLLSPETMYYLKSFIVILVIAAIGATPLPKKLYHAACNRKRSATAVSIAEPVVLLALLALCTAYLIDGSFNPFLYFRF